MIGTLKDASGQIQVTVDGSVVDQLLGMTFKKFKVLLTTVRLG